MVENQLQIVAGFVSSIMFISSNLPMLYKALRTRNLRSYSLVHIGLANVGNLLHWVYVAGLPPGPVYLLHGFNTVVAVIMLCLYLHYETQFTWVFPFWGAKSDLKMNSF